MYWEQKIAFVKKLQQLTEEGNIPWKKCDDMFMLEIYPGECVTVPFISAKYPICIYSDPTFLTIVHEGARILTIVGEDDLLSLLYRTAKLQTLGVPPVGGEDEYTFEMISNLLVRY